MTAKFGPAGGCERFAKEVKGGSAKAPAWLSQQGLTCYEYQCGKGVNIGEKTARELGENAEKAGIALSLHAPYFINLANPDPQAQQKTIGYILDSCRAASFMGATRIVIHTGALMKRTRAQALETAMTVMQQAINACDDAGFGEIHLCPETMGKIGQLGDLQEVLALCQLDARMIPCIDFGHLYARTLGQMEGDAACEQMLNLVEQQLGEQRASMFHSHFSHIEFTPNGGEKRHETFADGNFGPQWHPLACAVARRGWTPTFICESAGTQTDDAIEMKRVYHACLLSQEEV